MSANPVIGWSFLVRPLSVGKLPFSHHLFRMAACLSGEYVLPTEVVWKLL